MRFRFGGTTRAAVLGAVATAAALGLSGCGDDESTQTPPLATPTTITRPPTVTAPPDSEPTAPPLPAPAALTDVMARIADPNIPGVEKLDTIEMATPEDAVAMDRFGQALRDSGMTPTTFEARDLTWADGRLGNVLAVITIMTADADADVGAFTFPMEFHFADGHWQLTRETADALLQFGDAPAPTPTP